MDAFFTRQELEDLSEYLGMPVPEGLAPLPDPDEDADDEDRFWREPEGKLESRVARIALRAIQNRLPQCGFIDSEGRIMLGRQPFPVTRRDVVLLPRFLFMINWADTAPGLSWPESYYATYIPGFDQYVVTASQDSAHVYGATDLAIGGFPADMDIVAGSHAVIKAWWLSQCWKTDQQRWTSIWDVGLIDEETANAWANEIWNPGMKRTNSRKADRRRRASRKPPARADAIGRPENPAGARLRTPSPPPRSKD